jgi:hypothetical protein
VIVVGFFCGAQQYKLEIIKAGYMNLGPNFNWERGLRYVCNVRFPARESARTLWILIDLDGNMSWLQEETSPGVFGWTDDVCAAKELSVGQHTLRISLFDEGELAAPPGYPSGPVYVPPGWIPKAEDSITFTVYPPEIPIDRTDGIWISSTPLGAEVYLALEDAARESDGSLSLSKILRDEYYQGATPLFVEIPPGKYVVGLMIPANEELRLVPDDSFSRVVRKKKGGQVIGIGRGYKVMKQRDELASVIGLFQLRDVPLAEAFLCLPLTTIYQFNDDAMRAILRQHGVTEALTNVVTQLLHRTGKIVLEVGLDLLLVEIKPKGLAITRYPR